MKLTVKELQVLEYLLRYSVANGRTAKLSQLAEQFKFTRSAAHYFVKRLIAQDILKRDKNQDIVFLKNPNELREAFVKKTQAYEKLPSGV